MSRQPDVTVRSPFASKTAFAALEIDSGEETDEESFQNQPPENTQTQVEVRPSKSALRKAARQARIEKKQQEKAGAKQRRQEELERSPTTKHIPTATGEPSLNGSADTPEVLPVGNLPNSSHTVPHGPEPQQEVPTDAHPDLLTGTSPSIISQEPQQKETPTSYPDSGPPNQQPGTESLTRILPPTENINLKISKSSDQPVSEAEREKKRQNLLTRTTWTLIMIGGFIGLLLMGHAYMIVLVLLCQTLVYREVTALFSLATTDNRKGGIQAKDPWSKTLNWYFFAVTNYFLYGESIIYYFKHVVFADAQLLPFATNHRMISFALYVIGFMGFVMSLKKGFLKQQFGLFCWVHMTLLMIVVSSHFIVNNILEGLIWFWVPASLVICNDVFAYIWGITLGRTPLIKLSPKKTVEGFVGAFFSTVIFALVWGTYFMQFNYMICPVHDLGVSAWSSTQCKPNPVFVWHQLPLWRPLATLLSTLLGHTISTIPYAPYHLHLLFMSCFASLVAPFGGFFASGFKRAFDIKDFGHSIPGHGGMTDRMDCQFLMGVFTYVYYSSLIREHHVTVGAILQTIVSGLTIEEQLELIMDLRRYLGKQGIAVP